MDKNCVFCKIVARELPCHKIWEDDDHLAFLSIFPNTDGFTVVTSKKHLPSYAFDNNDKDLTNLLLATKKVAKLLDWIAILTMLADAGCFLKDLVLTICTRNYFRCMELQICMNGNRSNLTFRKYFSGNIRVIYPLITGKKLMIKV
ncbi:MAG: Histidine triad (HIT) family hydrolase [Candidatus Woesebacteria bacterium GW2011_GWA1_38_8]|uniref:Histidine triad (HIT) family hydrolase n=1 Tax=Candidatus Woesebacteria bacterium GW2011_GWA1_38_8 TaxID=1618547 RepID=A0A0G0KZH8_9BACT|nr:MAG: Histidine triad (HIT) family hydrolase [Candidatus Woesebacteria bacterium GW2011_GWA1_38_8]